MNEITFLKSIETLREVPDNQLQWLIENCDKISWEEGEYIFKKGDSVDNMYILKEGKVRLFFMQGNQQKEFGVMEPGHITGLLPFSRMKTGMGYGLALTPKVIFYALSREKIKSMIQTQYELTEALVHFMTSRVRDFTQRRSQDEKLMSLGKLSAGLAHELNNPASAVVRGAQELKKNLSHSPEKFKAIMSLRMANDQVDCINQLLFEKASSGKVEGLGMMERTEREDELTEWLDDFGVEDSDMVAETFVEFGFSVDELDEIVESIGEEQLPAVAGWMLNVLNTERIVNEVEDASERIASLVKSIKAYSYMDQAQDKQPVDMNLGLENTLTILQHKTRKCSIEIEKNFTKGLPTFMGFPGEFNQVWTNLIDNAIDALEETANPKINIETLVDRHFLKAYIKDNGPGIPEEVISQIFDPFFTTKPMGKGTGLGLDFCNKIVSQHQGSLRVTSQPGSTCFEVCVPYGSPEATAP